MTGNEETIKIEDTMMSIKDIATNFTGVTTSKEASERMKRIPF